MDYGRNAAAYSGMSGGFVNVPPMGGLSQPMPISPMQESRSSLTASVAHLHELLASLEKRLDGVCRMATPQTDSVGSNKLEVQPSELRAFLEAQSTSIHHACTRVDSLLSRLEL